MFKAPPDNLTPTLDTPQAAASAEWYANLLMKYGPDGILSYSDDQSMRSQMSGRANMRTQAITWMVPLAKHAESMVQKTVRYGLMPAGPKGNFPGSNSHGLGIPAGSKKKEAAWEFIKWALSKETIAMVVKNHGYPSVCRMSVIKSPEFKEVLTLNGQDVASLYPRGAAARRQDRLHEVPHRAGLSAGRRQDQQGDRAHRHQAAGGTRGAEAGAGRGDPGSAEGRDQG